MNFREDTIQFLNRHEWLAREPGFEFFLILLVPETEE